MSIHPMLKRTTRKIMALAPGLLCLALASPAVAQSVGWPAVPAPPQGYNEGPSEEVTVVPERPSRSTIGAPIEDSTLSEFVRYDDLNLSQVSDIISLRHRVRDTARRVCNRLAFEHPIGTPDTTRCRRDAVDNADSQVTSAIYNYPARSANFTP